MRHMRAVATSRGLQITAAVILVLLAALLLVQTYGKATRDIGYDFTSYLASASALAHGHNPYTTASVFQYVYPLFLAFVLIPLTVVPYPMAVILWYLVAAGSLVGALWIISSLAAGEQREVAGRNLIVPLCGIVILLFPVVQTNLLNGQVNFVVLVLCTLFLKFHLERRAVPSAFMLAMAIAIKLFPAILLVFVLIRKRYREFALTAVFAFALCVLPALLAGNEGFNLIRDYWQTVLPGLHTEVALPNAGRINFSLSGMIAGATSLAPGTWWLNLSSAPIAVLTIAWIHIRWRSATLSPSIVRIFSLYLLVMLLVSPLSEIHHLAFLLPAAIVLVWIPRKEANASMTARILIPAIFLVLFWLGELTDTGLFYFCAVIYLIVAIARSIRSE